MNYIETIKTVCMFLHMAVLTKEELNGYKKNNT